MGHFPILEMSNHRMTGAVAALRSLGKLYGYYPHDDSQAQQVDEIIYMNQKLQNRYWKAQNPRGNQKYFTDRYVQYLELYCAYLHRLRNVNSGSHYIVGDKLTVADLENANTMFTYLKNEKA
jgi:glutathione S-transferase